MKQNSSLIYCLLILLVSFFAFFVNNDIVPADLMESRNLATAQEMVRTGNYLVPTMNGELRLEKPPLPTWIAAGVEHISPDNLAAQRAASGLAATAMALFLFLLTLRMTGSRNIAVTAALILITCYNPVMMGRTASWDIYCHSFMLGAIYFLVRGCSARCRGAGWMVLSGFFMGLSFLSKGPVSFYALLIPFLIAYAIAIRPDMRGRGAGVLLLLVTAIITSGWWYGHLWFTHPETMGVVAGKESSAWLSYNVRPFWYYWQFPAEAGIWALFWLTAILYFFTNRHPGRNRRIYGFAVIWFVIALLLLSIVPEKKTRYLLPLLVPGAITIALYLWNLARNTTSNAAKGWFRFNGIVVALILVSVPVAFHVMFYKKGLVPLSLYIIIAVCFLSLAVFILYSLFRKGGHPGIKSVFAGIVLAMVAVEAFCLPAVGTVFINAERHSIKLLRDHPESALLPIYYEADSPLRMELVYEVNRLIQPIRLSDSTYYDKLPFILISSEPADSIFADTGLTVEHIDTYDNNWRKTDHKRHNKELVRHAAIIRAPQDESMFDNDTDI